MSAYLLVALWVNAQWVNALRVDALGVSCTTLKPSSTRGRGATKYVFARFWRTGSPLYQQKSLWTGSSRLATGSYFVSTELQPVQTFWTPISANIGIFSLEFDRKSLIFRDLGSRGSKICNKLKKSQGWPRTYRVQHWIACSAGLASLGPHMHAIRMIENTKRLTIYKYSNQPLWGLSHTTHPINKTGFVYFGHRV